MTKGRIGPRSQNLAEVTKRCYEITNGCQLDLSAPRQIHPTVKPDYYPTIIIKKDGEKIGRIRWDQFMGGYWEAEFSHRFWER